MRWALLALCACGDNGAARPDARVVPDTRPGSDGPAPYRHAIAIDGVDDFASGETLPTTSVSFLARVAWDDANLYIGYSGPDLSATVADAGTKWLFVYVDTGAGGEAQSELYRTQRATFPTGFLADYYARYKIDGTFATLEHFEGGDWVTASPAPSTAQAGTYLEMAISLSAIGAGDALGVVTWMINEKDLAEGTFAGIYDDNFVDGYAANLALAAYLHADFTASGAPNDPGNRRP